MTSSGQAAIQAAQARITDLERQLRQYQANGYTDQHPDIIATKEELAVARRERRRSASRRRATAPTWQTPIRATARKPTSATRPGCASTRCSGR